MLPLNAHHTYDRLRHSFEQKYCNPNANISERQLLYARRQQYGETAISYTEFIIKLSNKLQIYANEILRTARRGLLPDLHIERNEHIMRACLCARITYAHFLA